MHNQSVNFIGKKLALITAFELVLAFSGLGYIIPYATLMYIPVILAAYFYGVFAGGFLGFIFGLTSIWKASIAGVNEFDALFSPFSSGYVVESLILSTGTRIFFGIISGLVFSAVKKIKVYKAQLLLIFSVLLQLFHSVLVLSTASYLFPETKIDITFILKDIFSLRELLQAVLLCIVMYSSYRISISKHYKEFEQIVSDGGNAYYTSRFKLEGFGVGLIVLLTNLMLMYHLKDAVSDAMHMQNIALDKETYIVYLNSAGQFIVGCIAISYMIGMLVIAYRVYSVYKIYNSDKDLMTGLYTKAAALEYGKLLLQDADNAYFMIIDIDRFKNINDTFGHITGDRVIVSVATYLEKYFIELGYVARFGGDEFAVFITNSISRQNLIDAVKNFQNDLLDIPLENMKVTCSIGIAQIHNEKKFEEIYEKADEMLYKVKSEGRNGYAVYPDE